MEIGNKGVFVNVPLGFHVVEVVSPQDSLGQASREVQFRGEAEEPGRRSLEDLNRREAPSAFGFDVDAILQEALAEQAMVLAGAIDIAPHESSEGAVVIPEDDAAPVRRGTEETVSSDVTESIADFHVDVSENESAALLVLKNGVYQWVMPEQQAPVEFAVREEDPVARRGVSDGPLPARRVTFRLPLAVQPEPGEESGGEDELATRRNVLVDLLLKPVRVYAFKFLARLTVGAAIHYFERRTNSGFVQITQSDPAQWQPVADPRTILRPSDQPARILLMIHGTFSSTVGGYGALGGTEFGKTFLKSAFDRYDAVLGYDHPTLSVDPAANAAALLRDLKILVPPGSPPPQIDVIAHSRGGLVFRSLVEWLLPQDGWQVTWAVRFW